MRPLPSASCRAFHIVGDQFTEQVLLVKTAWGGKSLYKDFRPPSSGGEVGPYYTKMIAEVREALADLKTDFPTYADQGYELAGFTEAAYPDGAGDLTRRLQGGPASFARSARG